MAPSQTCWSCYFWYSPGCGWFSWLQTHITESYWSAPYPPTPPNLSLLWLLFNWLSAQCLYSCLGLLQPKYSTLHLALLSFMSFPQTHLLSLSVSLWTERFPPACQLPYTAWSLQQISWGCIWSHWLCCWQRWWAIQIPVLTPEDTTRRCSPCGYWTVDHNLFECSPPANFVLIKLSTLSNHVFWD